jgi:hypothetical protein
MAAEQISWQRWRETSTGPAFAPSCDQHPVYLFYRVHLYAFSATQESLEWERGMLSLEIIKCTREQNIHITIVFGKGI